MATHSNILAGKSHGPRSMVGHSPQGHKELDTTQELNNNNNKNIQIHTWLPANISRQVDTAGDFPKEGAISSLWEDRGVKVAKDRGVGAGY